MQYLPVCIPLWQCQCSLLSQDPTLHARIVLAVETDDRIAHDRTVSFYSLYMQDQTLRFLSLDNFGKAEEVDREYLRHEAACLATTDHGGMNVIGILRG